MISSAPSGTAQLPLAEQEPGRAHRRTSWLVDALNPEEAPAAAEVLALCRVVNLPSRVSRGAGALEAAALLAVEAGLVLVQRSATPPQRCLVLREARAGTIVIPPEASEILVALTDARITLISQHARDRLLRIPGAARALVEGLETAVRESRELASAFAPAHQVDRVREKLLLLGRQHGKVSRGGVRLDFPITHELLADMVGCARETVTRVLSELQRDGFVEREGRTYRLLIAPATLDR